MARRKKKGEDTPGDDTLDNVPATHAGTVEVTIKTPGPDGHAWFAAVLVLSLLVSAPTLLSLAAGSVPAERALVQYLAALVGSWAAVRVVLAVRSYFAAKNAEREQARAADDD